MAHRPQPSRLWIDKTVGTATTLCKGAPSMWMLKEWGVLYENGLYAPSVRSRGHFPVMLHPPAATDISS
jgi:hypothetical protein